MAKRLISAAMVCLLLLNMVPAVFAEETNTYLKEDFASYDTGAVPGSLICENGGGFVRVAELNGNKVLSLTNDTDGVYTKISKTFDEISGLSVTAGLAFMQKETTVSGNVILELSGSEGTVISIETLNGDIIYRTGEKTYEVLVKKYIPNFWYNISVVADLNAAKASVYVNQVRVLYRTELAGSAAKINTFLSYTAYSPGYYLDNLVVSAAQKPENIAITGESAVSIPRSGSARYIYAARVTDELGLGVQTPVRFSLMPDGLSGVRLENAGDNKAALVVDSTANAQSVTLSAVLESDAGISRSIQVQLKQSVPSKIEIHGSAQISGELEQKEWRYSAVCKDELGSTVSDEALIFGLQPADGEVLPDGIGIDEKSGLLTVSGSLSGFHQKLFRVTAKTADGAVAGTKNIKILNKKAYISDEARMNIMTEYADYVLEAGKDIYHGTPFLADGIDVGTGLPFEWEFPPSSGMEDSAVLSNLADQGGLMRFLVTLSEMTGDSKYKDKVMEIYDYFLDVGISPSGMAYWGGHTCFDLKTGKVLYSPNDILTHELKDHYPYMDPFYELDSDAAQKIVKSTWASHIPDFSTMIYNRHGEYTTKPNFSGTWDNLDSYDNTVTGLLASAALPFRYSADDFIFMATTMYDKTGDEKAKTWAYRLWERYANVCHPETHMGGFVFTSAYNAPGTLDIMKQPPVGHWWDATPLPSVYTWTTYGDRAYNQFADPLVAAGYITEEQKSMIREANMVTDFGIMAYAPQSELYLAKTLGYDTAEGRRVLQHDAKMLGSWVYYGYIPETNMMRSMLYDGTDISGYIWDRTGYYGAAGNSFGQYPITQTMLFSLISAYNESGNLTQEELTCRDIKNPGKTYNARDEIYKMLRNACIFLELGDIGDQNGNDIDLNYGTSCAHPKAAYALTKLYELTKRDEYLELARTVADNAMESHYANGVFRDSLSYINANFSIQNEWYPMMLISLEAISRGEGDKLPQWMPYNGYWSCDLLKPDGTAVSKAQAPWTAWVYTYESVKPTEIVLEKDSYNVKCGETFKIPFTVEPDDAADKSVSWYADDESVVQYDDINECFIAAGTGETVLHGISGGSLKVTASVKVIVE